MFNFVLTKKEVLIGAKEIKRNWPANLSDGDKALFQKEQNRYLDPVNLNTYKNNFVNSSGIIFSYLQVEKDCLIWDTHIPLYSWVYIVKQYIKKTQRILDKNKTAILCFDYWSDGYFHWICEALPRILLIEERLSSENIVLLLPERFRNSSFYTATLNAFRNIAFEWISENDILKCTNLLVPGRVAPSGSNNPEYIKQVQKRMLEHFGNTLHPYKNIYVSRKRTKRRKVLNEDKVIEMLQRFDFEIICFEDFSFEGQVNIMQKTKNCISIHGANLTNTIFMNEGSNVLEFRMKNDSENNYYYALATACGVNYFYQTCEFKMFSTDGNDFNLKVDLLELERNIKRMIN